MFNVAVFFFLLPTLCPAQKVAVLLKRNPKISKLQDHSMFFTILGTKSNVQAKVDRSKKHCGKVKFLMEPIYLKRESLL